MKFYQTIGTIEGANSRLSVEGATVANAFGMSFGELVQRLWQPESEEPEPKASSAKKKQSAGKRARTQKK